MKVGIHEFSPLTKFTSGSWGGFEVELWEKIAQNLNIEFEYVSEENFQTLLDKTEKGEYELAMAGISRTAERREKLDMSFLTLDSGLTILTRKITKLPVKELIINLFNSGLGTITLILFVVAFVVANIFWLIEKGQSVAEGYGAGIFESFWWSIATFSTVGYGDIFPLTVLGKSFGILAIMVGLAVFGLYIANLSAALSAQRSRGEINGLEDLSYVRVGTKTGTSTLSFLSDSGITAKEYTDIKDAYKALLRKEIDAVVFDSPVLRHDMRTMLSRTTLVGEIFARQTYAFIAPKGSRELMDRINGEIIRLHDDEEYDNLYAKYFE